MDYIRKLPLLMGLTVALIVGMAGRTHKVPDKENMFQMLITMLVFYVIGYFIRATILSVLESVKQKEEEKKRIADKLKKEKSQEKPEQTKKASKGKIVDIKTNDDLSMDTEEEGFQALPVVDFIKKELNQ